MTEMVLCSISQCKVEAEVFSNCRKQYFQTAGCYMEMWIYLSDLLNILALEKVLSNCLLKLHISDGACYFRGNSNSYQIIIRPTIGEEQKAPVQEQSAAKMDWF